MTVPIDRGSANQSLPQRRDVGPSDSAKDHVARRDFAALMEAEQASSAGTALGYGDASSARIFNAEGFFGRLQSQCASLQNSVVPAAPEGALDKHSTMIVAPSSGAKFEQFTLPDASGHPTGVSQPSSSVSVPAKLNQAHQLRPPLGQRKDASRPSGQRGVDHDVNRTDKVRSAAKFDSSRAGASAIRVTLSAGLVHISGRIELLTSDEEQLLVKQIAQLLADHGLAPANIRLNGQLVLPLARKG